MDAQCLNLWHRHLAEISKSFLRNKIACVDAKIPLRESTCKLGIEEFAISLRSIFSIVQRSKINVCSCLTTEQFQNVANISLLNAVVLNLSDCKLFFILL